jgi:hypothetical protein
MAAATLKLRPSRPADPLTVANNVAIDVTACSGNPADSAVNIARQIAAKVPT